MVAAIGALTRNHHEYIARPFLISATCKCEDTTKHAEVLQLMLRSCSQGKEVIRGKVYCVASDGKAR